MRDVGALAWHGITICFQMLPAKARACAELICLPYAGSYRNDGVVKSVEKADEWWQVIRHWRPVIGGRRVLPRRQQRLYAVTQVATRS
jgi:hypothetical protein